jgi:LuxR family maltose regulon positive regulatory protein
MNVLEALSLYQLKRQKEAMDALVRAYDLAAPNNIIILFIQYGKEMRKLTAAALRDGENSIPEAWLEDINRKSSAYAKRKAKMMAEYRLINNPEDVVPLTESEIAILQGLSQGLSRSEIAARQNISANTVKLVINIIYDKLCVTSLPDAIHTAVDRKII